MSYTVLYRFIRPGVGVLSEASFFIALISNGNLLKYKGMKKGESRFYFGKWNLNSD